MTLPPNPPPFTITTGFDVINALGRGPASPDFETLKALFKTCLASDDDRESEDAEAKLLKLMPSDVFHRLYMLYGCPDFEPSLRRFTEGKPLDEPAPKPPAPKAALEPEPEPGSLLPFSVLFKGQWIPAEGYAIDEHCRPHGVTGRSRKRGPLFHQRFFNGGKFREGYKLTIPGIGRRLFSYKQLAAARYKAEHPN